MWLAGALASRESWRYIFTAGSRANPRSGSFLLTAEPGCGACIPSHAMPGFPANPQSLTRSRIAGNPTRLVGAAIDLDGRLADPLGSTGELQPDAFERIRTERERPDVRGGHGHGQFLLDHGREVAVDRVSLVG